MTHKQIWTEIAEAFLTSESEGTERQKFLAASGLCFAASILGMPWAYSAISQINPIGGHWLPIRGDRFSIRRRLHRRKYDLIRADMATLFACMTEREFNLLLAGTPAQQRM